MTAVDFPATSGPATGGSVAVDLYLDLLARALTRYGMDSALRAPSAVRLSRPVRAAWTGAQQLLGRRGLVLARRASWDPADREEGRDWPNDAETMVGLRRLANLRDCLQTVVRDRIDGDVLEAGVWRGGASIFMRGVLVALGEPNRRVWLADSFRGLPAPDVEHYPQDAGLDLHTREFLAVSQSAVRANFERYDLFDENVVRFLPGWFKDTMPSAPVDRLALLRVDGDMYESTMQVLDGLYEKVSPGGFVVIDDYLDFPECRLATDDFRRAHGIADPIVHIDWTGVFWRKQ